MHLFTKHAGDMCLSDFPANSLDSAMVLELLLSAVTPMRLPTRLSGHALCSSFVCILDDIILVGFLHLVLTHLLDDSYCG